MGSKNNPQHTIITNKVKNEEGMVFFELILVLSIAFAIFVSFMKINTKIDRYRYKKFRTYHKTWKAMEVRYGANSQKYKTQDFIPFFN